MLQGACCSRPVYGHSHYKKFWLKKMESEDEQQSRLTPEPEYFRVSSERSGAFWRSRASTGGICSSLELKGSGTSRIRLSPVRSTEDKPRGASKQNLTTSEGTELECALALGLQMSHRDSCPPLKRSAFRGEMGGEEQKPWEAIRQSRHKLFHSQSGRSRAGGDRDPFPVKKECRDPGEVFGREEPGEEIGSDPQQQLEGSSNLTRMCAHCKTVNTPLWRNGPNGPKTLCNACGIRYKKIGRRGEQQSSLLIKRKQEADLHHPPRKKSSASVGKSFATDAEEGAALLMGLSSGLVDALA